VKPPSISHCSLNAVAGSEKSNYRKQSLSWCL
jgi:hypothetical protein